MNSEDRAESAAQESFIVSNKNARGRKWFGRTVQTGRHKLGLSVSELSSRVDLAEGTIRAIERGARAPSEATGVRLLSELFTDNEWSEDCFGPSLHALKDPNSGQIVSFEFGAKVQGDNGRWSKDQATPPHDFSELRETLEKFSAIASFDPAKIETHKDTLSRLGEVISKHATHMAEPMDDANIGMLTRRLPELSNLQAEYLKRLIELWSHINSGIASKELIDDVQNIEKTLSSYLTEEELREFSEESDN